ncbi:hypothetical protein [Tolypothrix sp. VBCCA 56010]
MEKILLIRTRIKNRASLIPIAHCPLPIAHCPLPIAHCPMPNAQFPIPS